ncbi:HAD family hydrolase [Tissierellaceae bacterium HCP3S3_D8]
MKAAIFDLDGTLIDSMWLWRDLANNYLLSIGVEPPEDLRESLKELSILEASFYMKDRFNLKKSPEEINSEIESILTDYYANRFELKPHVLEVLNTLKKRNIKICVATATDDRLALSVLNRLGIKDYFEFIQTCNSTGLGKNESKFFQVAVDRLEVEPEETWVFEDTLHCMISAKKCGLNVVAIKDDSALMDIDEIKRIADIFIDDFSKLEVENL